ncbi:MAG: flagellar basal body P-ring formation chaperone FlgA [Planctomycetota bacterium]|nr:flagellar basal body P-ring formation chaperone FlgA [Planctomycetota bacterium]
MKMNGFITRGLLVSAALAIAGVADAGVVLLRDSAVVDAAGDVTLADVARLEGADAEELGGVVIVRGEAARSSGRVWIDVSIDDVRAALKDERVNWGRVSLQGRTCTVRLAAAPEEEGRERKAYARAKPGEVEIAGPETVKAAVVRTLCRLFEAEVAELRLLFQDRDAEFLAQRTWGRRIETQPTGLGRLTPVRVIIYEGERIAEERLVRIEAEVQRSALVLGRDIRRGETINASDLKETRLWLDPSARVVGSVRDAAGQKARTRLGAGEALQRDHLESPVLVERGALVHVRSQSGGEALTARARPMEDGRERDLIELRLDGAEKAFVGRVDGSGRVVLDLDARSGTAVADVGGDKEQRR